MYLGHAEFINKNSIKVGKHILQFSRAVVCTGAKPTVPNIPGLRNIKYLTHESIFNLTELPDRLAIIGAGPIGVEIAQAMSCFGSKVVVFDTHDRIMKNEDKEACMIIQNKLHERFGVEFYFNAKINNIAYKQRDINDNGILTQFSFFWQKYGFDSQMRKLCIFVTFTIYIKISMIMDVIIIRY